MSIVRRPITTPPVHKGPRVNDLITVAEVRLINEDGENIGVISAEEAIERAFDAGLDLVEVSPNTSPPVCKILDFGKYKYKEQKKANVARKKQKVIDVKEIKMRPGIDTHDYEVKMRSIQKFLSEGDKVKVTLRFRGRELAHQSRGLRVLKRVQDDLGEVAKVEQFPAIEGRQITMVVAPR